MAGDAVPGDRDRDARGRARNARPRDELGRPLARSPVSATVSPTESPPVERVPDDLVVTPAEAADLGGRLLAEGRPFHAHEVFEAAWKSVPGPERELWRGLAQIAVGLTHARRENAAGAVALLRRGAANVRESAALSEVTDVDPHYVVARAEDMAARIERAGLSAVTEAEQRLRLRP